MIDLYLTGVLPEYQSANAESIAVQRPGYLVWLWARVSELMRNPELETNNAVQAQGLLKREHHKTRRAYIKQLKGKS